MVDIDGKSPGNPPSGNAYLRALASNNVQKKVPEGQVGPIGSITLGVQAVGKQVKSNLLGSKLNIGGTVAKVEYSAELGSQGITQSFSATAGEGAGEIDIFGILNGELKAEGGEVKILLSSDSQISNSLTEFDASADGNVGPLSIDGEISAKISAFGITAGVMVDPLNMLMSFKNLYSTIETYFNQLANESMNPKNSAPDDH